MTKLSPELKSDYNQCRSIIKKYSKSFYYAFSSLPDHDANAVFAIYAFCRQADDAIDFGGDPQACQENLKQLIKQLDDFTDGIVPDEPMWRALDHVRSRYNIDTELLYAQIKGQEMDIDFKQPRDIDELITYSKLVAGSVGKLLLPILSEDCSAERLEEAEKLGVAMQFTNILRDIGEDANDHNRVYIPVSLLETYEYSLEELHGGLINTAFINGWEYLAQRAEIIYDEFRAEIIHYKKEARLPLLVSLSVYREILNEVRRNEYDCFTKRNIVSFPRKMKIKNDEEEYVKNLKDNRVIRHEHE